MNNTGIKWTARTKYVDIETGELIKPEHIKDYYIIITIDKYTWVNQKKTHGQIEYTKQCRRNPQQRIF